jgi:hypothetical protein
VERELLTQALLGAKQPTTADLEYVRGMMEPLLLKLTSSFHSNSLMVERIASFGDEGVSIPFWANKRTLQFREDSRYSSIQGMCFGIERDCKDTMTLINARDFVLETLHVSVQVEEGRIQRLKISAGIKRLNVGIGFNELAGITFGIEFGEQVPEQLILSRSMSYKDGSAR